MWTLCSIGSNQDPAANTARTIEQLAQWFGRVKVSPLIETDAVDVAGGGAFLNGLVRFETALSDLQLKARLVDLEIRLGRDRDHPDSKTRPRPMDIDILDRALRVDALATDERSPYLDAMLSAEQGDRSAPRWEISIDGQLLGQEPTTVYFDDRTGHVRVVNQQMNGVQHRLQPALTLEQGIR